jgi:hypothetical protein
LTRWLSRWLALSRVCWLSASRLVNTGGFFFDAAYVAEGVASFGYVLFPMFCFILYVLFPMFCFISYVLFLMFYFM